MFQAGGELSDSALVLIKYCWTACEKPTLVSEYDRILAFVTTQRDNSIVKGSTYSLHQYRLKAVANIRYQYAGVGKRRITSFIELIAAKLRWLASGVEAVNK